MKKICENCPFSESMDDPMTFICWCNRYNKEVNKGDHYDCFPDEPNNIEELEDYDISEYDGFEELFDNTKKQMLSYHVNLRLGKKVKTK